MPSKNSLKTYVSHQYYHVYNRGVAKQNIFLDTSDKQHFIKIVQRHLDPTNTDVKTDGVAYQKFNRDVELLCYCLMGNHFHMLFYLKQRPDNLSLLMRSVLTAYTMYFNKKYRRQGTLFQGVFKAAMITDDSHLLHITRYIHLNPRTYKTYYYSSLRYYLGRPAPVWLHHARILKMFHDVDYENFVEDYEANHAMLEMLKHELADT